MTDIRNHMLPRTPDGPVMWAALRDWIDHVHREMLARFDVRNPQNDFKDGIISNGTGVTLGTGAKPVGRNGSVADIVVRIGDTGRAVDQRLMPMVGVGNRHSVQSIDPLSSSGSNLTAQINIASHTLIGGDFTVAYGSGAVTGLTPLTTYHVYANDPEYAGGAVAYSASETRADIVSVKGRYYVGEIITADSAPAGTVTAATNANPCAVTVVAHGFSTGNSITFAGMVGMTELNGNTYVITKTGPDGFTLNGTNSTGYGVFVAGGTATRASAPVGNWSAPGGGWPFNP